MKIGVPGSQGMLGKAVTRALKARGHDWIPERPYRNMDSVDAIINCAGKVKGRPGISDAEMVYSNSYYPHELKMYGKRIIHVSTDCIFQHNGPHFEASDPQCHDIYSRSKLAGEIHDSPHLTIRTSFIGHGSYGLLAELRKNTIYYASKSQFWTGHTVDTIAELLVFFVERPDITGLLHVPGQTQTRYDLCLALKQKFALPVEIIENNEFTADRRLDSKRWRVLSLPHLPAFAEQLQKMGDV